MSSTPQLRRLATLTAVTLVGVAALTGCSDSKSGSAATGGTGGATSGAAAGKVKIGLITKTETNPFFVKLRESAKAQADKQGAELVALAGKFDGDNEGQVAAIENLIQQGAKGILVTPNNSTGLIASLKKAKEKGILVIALDTETDPKDAVDATYATNNVTAGELQGKYVKAALGGTAPKILMMDGTAGGTVDEMRHRGFLQGIGVAEGDPAILGKQNTNGDQNKAQAAMENLLQRSTDVNAVYTINEPAAAGAYAALAAKGLADKVKMASIDGGCPGVQNVKAGKILATVMQFPKKMAEQGVDAVVKFAKDGTKPSGFQDTGAQLISDKPMAGLDIKDTAWGLQNCWG
ncbi:MAG: substrate-binding domain-containing protein [Austwickia sp.]|nr:substrate-binding domain-containing protein [Actinomycetota bacterium]MCB1254278.1 substrate-binding domain-containing protein [Austwickia sp.]MCO5309956.1 substrate-binding domain-containing protein [Austwickia sp.]